MQSISHLIVGTRTSDDEMGQRFFVVLQANPRPLPNGTTAPTGMRFEVEFADASDDDRTALKKGATVTFPAPVPAKA